MSKIETSNLKTVTDSGFDVLCEKFTTAAGAMWLAGSELAYAACRHALSHDGQPPERLKQAYVAIFKADVSTVLDAYKRAVHQLTGQRIKHDEDGNVTTDYDKSRGKQIREVLSQEGGIDQMLSDLENKGLKAYKKKVQRNSTANGRATDRYAVRTKEILKLVKKMEELGAESSELDKIFNELTNLEKRLEVEVAKLSPATLAAKIKPEGESKADKLRRELAEAEAEEKAAAA